MQQQPLLRLAADHGRLVEGTRPESADLRRAMRLAPGAVSVVTVGTGDARTGATVTTAHSFSTEPETMLVSIALASSTWAAIEDFGHFCVNLLHADQIEVARRFSGFGGLKGAARYEGADWSELSTGAAVLEGALASIDCEVEHVVKRHSHALVFGAVRAVLARQGPALVYRGGSYSTFD